VGVSAIPAERTLIIWHPGPTPPAGYIKANGALLDRTVYAWLFSKIGTTYGAGDGVSTFATIDLRAEFLRGLDDGRGIDVGRVLGSVQAGGNLGHSHEKYIPTVAHCHVAAGSSYWVAQTDGSTYNSQTGSSGGAETRPRNVAGLFCIAYAP